MHFYNFKKLQEEWRIIFYASEVIFFIGGLQYSVFASSVPEKWALVQDDEIEEKENEFENMGMNIIKI